MTTGKSDRPRNSVRVGYRGTKFLFVDITKHLLHDGEKEVYVSALGGAINEAVSVVEMLKDQQMVVVKKITTSRQVSEEPDDGPVDKIEIVVTKADGFDAKYEEQQKAREAKRLEKEKNEKEKATA
ncbi:ALBA-Domain Protein [Trypanosoma equiperdum]|uniref:DNA/RNA-binding protein Alba-like domain-containing protein n=4 Tax=Trypanozoon TaxID=39700 RepID=Q385X1_TRYB2|nr:hypothetical protein, conserved [Trypanosoma brucei gambiense DAL972]XP_828522.1 hypothetical protein, conserved [Trypanosoma brucei brucei TREU927]RHW67028.1 ALBA-Domain Protein [Trypanosoma brucei equiperdum]SCU70021.1 ALBA-Domain Protein [Trypanosoma equiperdum]EAN79410.1 hypothetical protein, conserved [Trypanosoma brucei brucei TREU927]CBH17392.1 hypothetical protein, conserved [Trypanosoma brucei gambiense DAL972]|eukprot:XP_011779656.1 hypothetical protein, conserved [Trypanosoma brucei gambiense DAL972]